MMNHLNDTIAHLNDAQGALNRVRDTVKRYWPEGQEVMADDFRHWGLKDVALLTNLMAVELAWLRDCRHSQTEDIANERARCAELSQAMRAFNNERLAPNGGKFWIAEQGSPLTLLDSLTVVDNAFINNALAKAIPAYGSTVRRRTLDGKYWLPSPRDALRIVEHSIVNTFPYVKDKFDCDDFAEALRQDFRSMGINSCAYVIDDSAGHAYNAIILPEGFWFLEPQHDKIVNIGAGIYKLMAGEILL